MRRDLITRTISGTEVIAKVVNKATDEISEKSIVLNKVVTENDKAAKLVAKQLTEDEVLISIKSLAKVDKMYGITPADFIAHAIELDPATREAIKTEATEA